MFGPAERSKPHGTATNSAIVRNSLQRSQGLSGVSLPHQTPVKIQLDMLTAIYCQWSYRHLHRGIVALDALMHTPPLSEPQFKHGQSVHEYTMAVSLWLLQWEIESEEARFSREMLIPVEGGIGVSLRAYVRGLTARMADAGRAGIFDDLDHDDAAATLKAMEKAQLVLEARACMTFALAHDVRWRRVIMHTPDHLFRECPPTNNDRMHLFVDTCVQLTARFIDGDLTLAQVAEMATHAWLYG